MERFDDSAIWEDYEDRFPWLIEAEKLIELPFKKNQLYDRKTIEKLLNRKGEGK
jgi:hypothetical protein